MSKNRRTTATDGIGTRVLSYQFDVAILPLLRGTSHGSRRRYKVGKATLPLLALIMAPKSTGGLGHRDALDRTQALWDEGLAESEVRQRLREAGYSAPRICQLMKATRPPQAAPPPAKAAPSERKRKASNEQDDLAAALAAWPHEVVQALAAQIAEARAGVPANSHLTRATLQGFIDHVPDSVRACFPPLGALLVQLSTDDSDLPPDLAKRILTRLSAIAAQADAFWEEHPSSVASASAPTAPA